MRNVRLSRHCARRRGEPSACRGYRFQAEIRRNAERVARKPDHGRASPDFFAHADFPFVETSFEKTIEKPAGYGGFSFLRIPFRFELQKVVYGFGIRNVQFGKSFELDSRTVEHALNGAVFRIVVGFDIQVDDALDSRLHDGLRAVRARVQRAVENGTFQVPAERIVYGVAFGVDDVGVFRVFRIRIVVVGPKPRIGIVESHGKAVVSDSNDFFI